MLDGPAVVAALKACGVTHVVWIPDSELGTWEPALTGPDGLPLIRVCREGEAFAVAAGLLLGGRKPVVLIQCTGLFEAGDALRNVVHDLKLPLFLIVGVRSYYCHQEGQDGRHLPRLHRADPAGLADSLRVLDRSSRRRPGRDRDARPIAAGPARRRHRGRALHARSD